nr:PREDICTED: putative GTP-binding protein 6 [Bemisia tabaci]
MAFSFCFSKLCLEAPPRWINFCQRRTMMSIFYSPKNAHQNLIEKKVYSVCNAKVSSLIARALCTTNSKLKYGGNKMLHDSFDHPETEELKKLLDNNLTWDGAGEHKVLVLQPYIKWGPNKKTNTNPDLMLAEAVSLVKSLPKWTIADKRKIGVMNICTDKVFGTGQIDAIASQIHIAPIPITAVFVSIDKLSNEQYFFLCNRLQVPVFDRYSIVIQIFKEHAKSSEAKLQVALAELPYIVGRFLSPHYDRTKKILMKHQKEMKASLAKLEKHRAHVRKNRKALEFPVVAVVGYTNAGKTSLIKALTADSSLTPQNVLFATLDVTMHEGSLPCNLKVLYADTIGFIADLPIELIQPFRVTLEDAMLADVIIHVMDVSHPNHALQYDEVINTLEKLDLSPKLKENVITVGNKSDLVPHEKLLEIPNEVMLVSATEGIGMNQLLSRVEQLILSSTNRQKLTVRVRAFSDEEQWLKQEAAIISSDVDPNDSAYALLKIVITPSKLNIFREQFIGSSGRRKNA